MRFSSFKMYSKKKGAAYVTVLIAFVIIVIFITTISTLFSGNLLQSKSQEKHIQAYYLARSGVDLAVTALLQQEPLGTDDTLLHKEFSSAEKPDLSSITPLTQTINLVNGRVDITISALDISGERWVKVSSIGTLTDASASRTVNLKFVVDNPSEQKWD